MPGSKRRHKRCIEEGRDAPQVARMRLTARALSRAEAGKTRRRYLAVTIVEHDAVVTHMASKSLVRVVLQKIWEGCNGYEGSPVNVGIKLLEFHQLS